MRNAIILLGLAGYLALAQASSGADAVAHEVVAKPGDTLAAIAEARYGVPEYAGLIAHHNDLAADTIGPGTRLALPDIDAIVSGMPALAPHRDTVDVLLQSRNRFGALVEDLRQARANTPLGVDKPVPDALKRALLDTASLLEDAEAKVLALKVSQGPFPERLHTAIVQTVDELRLHAAGRYHTRPVSIRQTEKQVARIFAEVLTWQKALSGEIPKEKLVYPRCRCG